MKALFVCSGNIFRSMSAEFCLKDYILKNKIKGIEVTSAGTHANPEHVSRVIAEALLNFGIDCSSHVQTRLTRQILDSTDVIICMANYHLDFIVQNFGNYNTFLFNEIAFGRKESVWDVEDVVTDWYDNPIGVMEHEIRTVEHIHNSIPNFVKNLPKFSNK